MTGDERGDTVEAAPVIDRGDRGTHLAFVLEVLKGLDVNGC